MPKELPSAEMLRKLLRYDPKTGKLFWRKRDASVFSDGKWSAEYSCNLWNSKSVGKEAFTASTRDGYKCGRIFGRNYKAHRVIWALAYMEWPPEQIDHINGVRDDNRIENLRAVTNAENGKNQKRPSNNKSEVMGVSWDKTYEKWQANIRVGGKQKHLGRFNDFEAAVDARKAAEVKYGYHKNHGRLP